jgi:hypothetical protein
MDSSTDIPSAPGARRAARRRALKDGAVTGDGFAAVVTRAGHVVYSARAVACAVVDGRPVRLRLRSHVYHRGRGGVLLRVTRDRVQEVEVAR